MCLHPDSARSAPAEDDHQYRPQLAPVFPQKHASSLSAGIPGSIRPATASGPDRDLLLQSRPACGVQVVQAVLEGGILTTGGADRVQGGTSISPATCQYHIVSP